MAEKSGVKLKKGKISKVKHAKHAIKPAFWFTVGVLFASFCLAALALVYFKVAFKNHVIPGVFIGSTYVGGKTPEEVEKIFLEKNVRIQNTKITFYDDGDAATASAKDLNIGYDTQLLKEQAESIGKSADVISNVYYIINSYLNGTYLNPSYTGNLDKITALLDPIQKKTYIQPQDALFKVENNRVTAFQQSTDGKSIDFDELRQTVQNLIQPISEGHQKDIAIKIPVKILKPTVTTEKANNFGIVEEIGEGSSMFGHSIPNRIDNIVLATSKINGVLVAPNEVFSFDKYLGDVSKNTGYKQAYVIQNGKTVLGDGGGVCQVSTTLFRAILNAGLPVVERNAHAYRVGYYEEDSPPGIDATVFYPSVDLKFKNDTGNYILIQSTMDLDNLKMSFILYGKKDGRVATLTTPVITNQIPAPEPIYQDDPTLPKGTLKQVDFAAAGATVIFSRTVTRGGKVIIQDTYKSVYQPWHAAYVRGTG
ncbi:MAG: VanW family protein [Candidatus Levyibacteriota bacterium]